MPGQVPPFLSDEHLKLLLFGGKGGVGKTTTAAATALYRASQRQERILIISTDPAHSLSDSLDQPIGDEVRPIEGMPNLFALEIDAGRRLEDFKQRYGEVLKTIADRGTYFDQEDISEFLDLSLPGLDELMAVIEIADVVKERRYDLVILDTAPTGHTLRLLGLPGLMEQWLHVMDLMLEKHRYMLSVFGRYKPDETDAFLKDMASNLARLRALLCDARSTEFVPVTIPEAMSIEETARMLQSLQNLAIRVRTVVVNRLVVDGGCPFCAARQRGQEGYLEEIRGRFAKQNLVFVPLMPQEVRGRDALERYAQALRDSELWPWPSPRGLSAAQTSLAPNLQYTKEEQAAGARPILAMILPTKSLQQQLVLFGGKGGVGKTTVAAATAIHLARGNKGRKVLLFSTDPAHSLSDSLGQRIGNQITPVAGVERLFALEIDAAELLEELNRQYVAEIDEVFDAFLGGALDATFDRRVMEELISLTPPGLDELMALMRIMDLAEEGAFDQYVLDLAPTGHALRFLEMPGMVRQWFITFFKLLVKYQGVVQLPRMAALLREKSKQLRGVHKLLSDSERCQFIAVTIPEVMALEETKRLLHRLGQISVTCRWVVVNMMVPWTECDFCASVRVEQERHLPEIAALGFGLIQVPLFPQEVKGVEGLTKVARAVYGGDHG